MERYHPQRLRQRSKRVEPRTRWKRRSEPVNEFVKHRATESTERTPCALCGSVFYTRFIALNIASRCSRMGSFSTLLSLLKTIVGLSFGLNDGHRGSFGVLGSPFRANAIHASLTLSARVCASGLLDVSRDALTLSNAKGISIV